MSQIYTELRRLEELGFVSHRQQELDELRNKRVYRITEAGLAELARWVSEGPADPPNVLKHLTCMRAFYGHLVPPEVLRARLDEHVAWAERGRTELERILSAVHSRSQDDPRWRYTALVIEWGIDNYAGEAAGAARLADRLSSLPNGPDIGP
jgi:DNA-binding PadR family transcriptional regulator